MLLAYIVIPVVEKEVNDFKDIVWNTHRIRVQKDAFLPNGIPNHVYSFPGKYGLEECGMPSYITEIKVISLIKLLNIINFKINMKIHSFISVGVGHQEEKGHILPLLPSPTTVVSSFVVPMIEYIIL